MLDALRRGANTLVAKLLLGLLVVSFAVWGVADAFRMNASDTVATVGNTKVDVREFQRRYRVQLDNLTRQMSQAVSGEMASALGVPQQIVSGLTREAAYVDAAGAYGLGVSDELIGKAIADDPSLRPPGSDTFNSGYFLRLLQENGMTESDFVRLKRAEALRSQIENGFAAGVSAPDALIDVLYKYESEIRSIDYVKLTAEDPTTIASPTDADLAKWFEDNKAEFRAPEYRSFSVIEASPDTLANPDSVSVDDARKEYERTKAQFTTPAERHIFQLVFPTVDEAKAASDKIKAGTSFDAIVTERNLKPEDIDLGMITIDKVVDPKVAETAFAMTAPGVSDALQTAFGGALINVTEVKAEAVAPFESVETQIRTDIAKRTADQTVLETSDEVEDARAAGATLKEISERFKLKLVSIPSSDENGLDADGKPIAAIGEQDKVLKAVFASDEGNEDDPIQVGKGFIWYSVEKVTTARDRTLDEVKDKALSAWKTAEARKRLEAKADELAKAAETGDLATAAKPLNLEVKKVENFDRKSEQADLGADAVSAAFNGINGHTEAVDGPDGTKIVLKVTTVINPPFIPEAANVVEGKKRYSEELQFSLEGQYASNLLNRLGVSINQPLIDAAIGANAQN